MFAQEKINELISSGLAIATNKFKQGSLSDAEIVVKQVLKVDQENKMGLQILGLIKHSKQEYEKSIDIFQSLLESDPENIENHNNLALSYAGIGKYEKSIELLEQATEKSSKGFLYSNLGLQYRNNKQQNEAIKSFKKSLDIEETAHTWGMLGGCYGEKQNLDEAERCFHRALEINPKFASAHLDLAAIYQLRGDWKKAWEEYEWRFEVFQQTKFWQQVYEPEKKWTGTTDVAGKRIIIHSEQGTGDSIHFVRYVPLLKKLGAHTILHCPESLRSLFVPLADEVYTKEPTEIPIYQKRTVDFGMPKYDLHCSIMSLPYLLKCNIPPTPYLHTEKTINLDDYKEAFKIGIVWGGNPQHPNDANRSCKLNYFRPIYELPNVKLFSLQKDNRPRAYRFMPIPVDLTEGAEDMKVVDLSEFMEDFEATAAIIKGMDLIISIDTAVVHLAGALNHPTWALLAWNSDWRWKLTGDTTEWYSSVKLIRQPSEGDWDSVFASITDRIKNDYLLQNKQQQL